MEREGNTVHGNFFPQPNTALRESKIPQSTVRMQQPVTAPYPLSSRYNNNTSTFFGSLSATFTLAFGLALPPRTPDRYIFPHTYSLPSPFQFICQYTLHGSNLSCDFIPK